MRTFSVMLAALASVTGVTSALSLPHESFPAARHPRAAIAGPAGGTRVGTGLSPQPKVVHNVAVREEDPDPADPEWYKMRILTWQARWVPWNMELKFTVNGDSGGVVIFQGPRCPGRVVAKVGLRHRCQTLRCRSTLQHAVSLLVRHRCYPDFRADIIIKRDRDLISALRDEIAAALGRGNELVGLDYRWQPITIGGTMAPPLGFFRAVVKPGEGDLVEKLSIYPLPVPSDSDSDDSGASGSGNNDVDSDSDDDDDDDDDGDDVVVPDVDMNAANGADDNGDDAVMPDFDEAHVKRANAKRDKANLDNGGIVPGNNRYDDHGDNAIVPDDGGPDRNQSDGEESQGDEFNESDSDLNDSDDDEFSDGEPWLPWKTVLPGEAKWALLNQEIITFLDMDMGGAVFYQGSNCPGRVAVSLDMRNGVDRRCRDALRQAAWLVAAHGCHEETHIFLPSGMQDFEQWVLQTEIYESFLLDPRLANHPQTSLHQHMLKDGYPGGGLYEIRLRTHYGTVEDTFRVRWIGGPSNEDSDNPPTLARRTTISGPAVGGVEVDRGREHRPNTTAHKLEVDRHLQARNDIHTPFVVPAGQTRSMPRGSYAYIELDGIHGAVALFFGSDAITVVNLDVAEGVHSLDYVQQAVLGSRTAVDNQCLDALWLLVPYAHEFGYVENLERPILAVVPDRRLWSNYFTWELFGQRDAGLDPIKGTWVLQLDPTRLWWQFEPPEASEELPGRSDSPQQRRGLVAVRDHQRGRRCTNKTADAPPPLQHVQDQIPFGRGPAPVDMAIRRATRTGRPQRFRDIPPAESKPRIA